MRFTWPRDILNSMAYKAYSYYCYACNKTIGGGLGIASHRRGKKHQQNRAIAKAQGKNYTIERS